MLFNRSATYNRNATFNRASASTIEQVFFGTAGIRFNIAAPNGYNSLAPYGVAQTQLTFTAAADALSALFSLPPSEAGIEFDAVGNLGIVVEYAGAEAGVEFTSSVVALRLNNDEDLILSGLNFAPGDVIIIDTDTLDILVNGVPDVQAWQMGSVFFTLQDGANTFTVYDNAESRVLGVTVVWADRWL